MLHTNTLPEHSLELLKKLAPVLASRGFYLAGGTALALRFGHRISVDLDFFSPDSFQTESLVSVLEDTAGEPCRVFQKTAGSLSVTVAETKIELFHYTSPLLAETEIHQGVNMASLADNGAMKLSALTNRGSKKDFYDISRLLDVEPLNYWLEKFQEKYPNSDIFMVLKSLTWFDDAEAEPDPRLLDGQTWSSVKSRLTSAVAQLNGEA